jgi:hypothetical protein
MAEEGFKRKLTAIFSADAVGYSRLMGDDEEATIRILTEYRKAITALVNQHSSILLVIMFWQNFPAWWMPSGVRSRHKNKSPNVIPICLKTDGCYFELVLIWVI